MLLKKLKSINEPRKNITAQLLIIFFIKVISAGTSQNLPNTVSGFNTRQIQV